MMVKRKGLTRLLYATYYSLKGLRAAFLSEAAVRQEVFTMLILIPVTFLLEVTSIERILLIMSLMIVLITELLNQQSLTLVRTRLYVLFQEIR